MPHKEVVLWVWAVTAGFVWIVAAAVLLSIMIIYIYRIHVRVNVIGRTLTAAKANTANTALIAPVATEVDNVLAEGLKHHLFLGRALEKVRL
jgi:hypothetical protein